MKVVIGVPAVTSVAVAAGTAVSMVAKFSGSGYSFSANDTPPTANEIAANQAAIATDPTVAVLPSHKFVFSSVPDGSYSGSVATLDANGNLIGSAVSFSLSVVTPAPVSTSESAAAPVAASESVAAPAPATVNVDTPASLTVTVSAEDAPVAAASAPVAAPAPATDTTTAVAGS